MHIVLFTHMTTVQLLGHWGKKSFQTPPVRLTPGAKLRNIVVYLRSDPRVSCLGAYLVQCLDVFDLEGRLRCLLERAVVRPAPFPKQAAERGQPLSTYRTKVYSVMVHTQR